MVEYGIGGRNAVVTGAGQGIGREIARQLALQGANVALIDRNPDALELLRRELEQLGVQAYAGVCDLCDEVELEAVGRCILHRFEKVDILVNNAGTEVDVRRMPSGKPEWFCGIGDGLDVPTQEYDRVLFTNLRAQYFTMRFFCPSMQEQGYGRVVNISSTTAFTGTHASTPYAASKAGIILQTRNMAKNLGRFGITVNCVSPGMVDTPMHDTTPRDQFDLAPLGSALGRIARPIDIARAVLFFCQRDLFITGQNLVVDGGGTLN